MARNKHSRIGTGGFSHPEKREKQEPHYSYRPSSIELETRNIEQPTLVLPLFAQHCLLSQEMAAGMLRCLISSFGSTNVYVLEQDLVLDQTLFEFHLDNRPLLFRLRSAKPLPFSRDTPLLSQLRPAIFVPHNTTREQLKICWLRIFPLSSHHLSRTRYNFVSVRTIPTRISTLR